MSARSGLQIRAPEAADAPGLAELFIMCGHSIATSAIASRLAAMPHGAGAALMAQEWGPPGAIVTLHWYSSLLADQATARLTLLLVAPESRRRGLARLLLKAASRAARQAGCDRLECFASGGQAELRAFLLATGFAQSGEHFLRSLRKNA